MLIGKGGELSLDGVKIGDVVGYQLGSRPTVWTIQPLQIPIYEHEAEWAEALRQAEGSRRSTDTLLIFADWLDEQGDLRGELLRCEVELHRPVADLDQIEIRRLVRVMRRANQIREELGLAELHRRNDTAVFFENLTEVRAADGDYLGFFNLDLDLPPKAPQIYFLAAEPVQQLIERTDPRHEIEIVELRWERFIDRGRLKWVLTVAQSDIPRLERVPQFVSMRPEVGTHRGIMARPE